MFCQLERIYNRVTHVDNVLVRVALYEHETTWIWIVSGRQYNRYIIHVHNVLVRVSLYMNMRRLR